jgi:hypothetical protein
MHSIKAISILAFVAGIIVLTPAARHGVATAAVPVAAASIRSRPVPVRPSQMSARRAAVFLTAVNAPSIPQTVFSPGLPRLYCWVRNSALPVGTASVTFIWAKDQPYSLIDRFTLARAAGTFTGAYETMAAHAPGRFRCAVTAAGHTVGAAPYRVTASAAASASEAGSGSVAQQAAASPAGAVAIGDSVMLDAAAGLASHGITVDAAVSRQWDAGVAILSGLAASGRLPSEVVVGLSTNGPISDAMFDQMMAVLHGVGRVVFVTVKVPRFWQDANNSVLRAGVARWPNARLADWYALSWDQAGWFADDGYHLTPAGAAAYAQLVVATLG